jgi:hypothetical protein
MLGLGFFLMSALADSAEERRELRHECREARKEAAESAAELISDVTCSIAENEMMLTKTVGKAAANIVKSTMFWPFI